MKVYIKMWFTAPGRHLGRRHGRVIGAIVQQNQTKENPTKRLKSEIEKQQRDVMERNCR